MPVRRSAVSVRPFLFEDASLTPRLPDPPPRSRHPPSTRPRLHRLQSCDVSGAGPPSMYPLELPKLHVEHRPVTPFVEGRLLQRRAFRSPGAEGESIVYAAGSMITVWPGVRVEPSVVGCGLRCCGADASRLRGGGRARRGQHPVGRNQDRMRDCDLARRMPRRRVSLKHARWQLAECSETRRVLDRFVAMTMSITW